MAKLTSLRSFITLALAVAPALASPALPDLLSFSPQSLEFDPTGVGSLSLPPFLIVTNNGPSPVTITSMSVQGANASDFLDQQPDCPVSPNTLGVGQSCYPFIYFAPSAAGLRLGTLVFQVSGGATQTVLLAGEGLPAVQAIAFSGQYLSFPELPLGDTYSTGQMWVINTGTAPVQIKKLQIAGPDASQFSLPLNLCNSVTLTPNNMCLFDVQFKPTATGPSRAYVQVTASIPGNVATLPLMGFGGPAVTSVTLFPPQLTFPPTGTGNVEQLLGTISNSGSQPVTIDNLSVTGANAPDFTISPNYCVPYPTTLSPGAQCDFYVNFTPSAVGNRAASLEVDSSVPGGSQSIPLAGVGEAPVIDLTYSPAPLLFPSMPPGQQISANDNLMNNGAGTAQLSFRITGADAADFSMPSYCPTLGPAGWCGLSVNFTPQAAGLRTARLTATDSVSGQKQSLILAGGGADPSSALNIIPSVFAPALVGTSTSGTITIGNSSGAPVTLTGITFGGNAQADFHVFDNGCRVGSAVQPNNPCTIQMTFTPSAPNTRMAHISVTYAGGGSPLVAPVAGLGLPLTSAVSFSPDEGAFGALPVGSPSTLNVYIGNSGDSPVALQSISLTGTSAGDYAIIENQCAYAPASMPPGASCGLTLQFTPTATGSRLANLTVADNASGSPQNMPLIGFGTNLAPALFISASLSFNEQPLNSSTTSQVQVQVQGGSAVTFSSVSVVGPAATDFSLANGCPTNLPPQSPGCTISVTFTPTVTGLRNAELVIRDNATGSPQILPLAGWGILSSTTISFNPVPLVFPQQPGVGSSALSYLQIMNSGTQPVQITGFQIGGTNAADFAVQSTDCPLAPLTIPPQSQCSVFLEFIPTAAGARVATLAVSDNAAGNPQSVSLVGAAAPPVKTLLLAPATVQFAPTPVGTTDYFGGSVTITNTGNVAVNLTGLRFSGPDAGDFAILQNLCPLSLAPGSPCGVNFNFTPSATGTRTAVFTVESDAVPSKQSVQLTGVGE